LKFAKSYLNIFRFLKTVWGAGFPQTRKTLWKSVNQKTASASKHCFLAQASFLKKLGSVLSVNAFISFAGGACRQAVCRPFTWPKGFAAAFFPLTLPSALLVAPAVRQCVGRLLGLKGYSNLRRHYCGTLYMFFRKRFLRKWLLP